MKHSTYRTYHLIIFSACLGCCMSAYYFYTHSLSENIAQLVALFEQSKHFIIHPNGTVEPVNTTQKTPSHPSGTAPKTAPEALQQLQEKKGYLTLFTPDDNTYDILLTLIETEQEKISIAIFSFTDSTIVHALAAARQQGITIELITDKSCVVDRYSKIDDLYHAGVTIYVYNPTYNNKRKFGIMHHKFIVFSKNYTQKGLVWTGSYNFTKSARHYNQENVIILNRKGIVQQYQERFEKIKKQSDLYTPFLTPQKHSPESSFKKH